HRRRLRSKEPLQFFETVSQNEAIAPRRHREPMIEIVEREGAGPVLQADLLRLENLHVRLAQDGDQDTSLKLWPGHRRPVDIEETGIRGSLAVFEDIVPPNVLVTENGHVVGHGIQDLPHAKLLQAANPSLVVRIAANLLVEQPMVCDVVSVPAAEAG